MKCEEMPKLDVVKYVGTEGKIIEAKFVNTKHGAAIKVTGEPIELKDKDTLPEGKRLQPSRIFGLSKNKKNELVIAKDGIFDKWLQAHKLKAEDVPEFELDKEVEMFLGIDYIVQKNKNDYLEIC